VVKHHDKPKSQILISQSSLISMLDGFRSRWTILEACKYQMPSRIWNRIYL